MLDDVRADIAAVREAVPQAVLKVIVESAALLEFSGEPLLVDICRVAEDAGADFVKTSTGYHPSGGASTRAVELMAGAVDGRLGVKASGGIRTAADAVGDARCRRDPARTVRYPRGARRPGLRSYRPPKQGSSVCFGIDWLLVENWLTTPESVT